MSQELTDNTVPSIPVKEAGGGGLGDAGGAPIREPVDHRDYRPEASVTGPAKGPAVPSSLPKQEILDRLERGGRAVENIERERWWKPHVDGIETGPIPTWGEICAKIMQDPEAKAFFYRVQESQPRIGVINFNDRHLYAEYKQLVRRYEVILREQPDKFIRTDRDGKRQFEISHIAAFVCYYGVGISW
jgi:hypothetical protein